MNTIKILKDRFKDVKLAVEAVNNNISVESNLQIIAMAVSDESDVIGFKVSEFDASMTCALFTACNIAQNNLKRAVDGRVDMDAAIAAYSDSLTSLGVCVYNAIKDNKIIR